MKSRGRLPRPSNPALRRSVRPTWIGVALAFAVGASVDVIVGLGRSLAAETGSSGLEGRMSDTGSETPSVADPRTRIDGDERARVAPGGSQPTVSELPSGAGSSALPRDRASADPPTVPASRTLDEIIGGSAGTGEPASEARDASTRRTPWVVIAVVAALLVFGALVLLRRRLPARGSGSAAGWVQVVGRVSLTPGHSIFAVRCGRRIVLVGVSGDRVTPVADWGEENALPEALNPIVATQEESSPSLDRLGSSRSGGMDSEHLGFGMIPRSFTSPSTATETEALSMGWDYGSMAQPSVLHPGGALHPDIVALAGGSVRSSARGRGQP
jgi:flagellar biogenesis protein FliO